MRSIIRLLVAAVVVALNAPLGANFTATLDSIKIFGQPGHVVTREFRLTLNPGQPKTRFRAHVQDWWRSEDGSSSYYRDPGTLQRSCGPWVTVNPVETDVVGGETMVARLTIAISPEAQSGGYWCVLTVDQLPDPLKAPEGVGMQFLTSVSVGIFVYIGDLQRAADIVSVEVSSEKAVVGVRNDGNTPLAIEGRFEFVKPGETEPAATVHLGRGTLLTEPIRTGLFSVKLPDAATLPSGRYLVRAIVDYGADHYIGVQRELDVRREADRERK